ncbi:uncharacterized protein N7483_006201 [Penicillium malachiteum]|uniref:uncharacterized protein n=1 Tax=Penicillium malachiteum TaxID=1324776 RepID=UPI002546FBFE|nr:uncharacterized protein N7483_006201 [Penicillium malachiteum]KAJ5731693.1 hypothetical protein N7483_006201 [Penicillium malachiteum]
MCLYKNGHPGTATGTITCHTVTPVYHLSRLRFKLKIQQARQASPGAGRSLVARSSSQEARAPAASLPRWEA